MLHSPPPWFRTARLGLLANQASVGESLRNVKDLIREAGGRLACIFSPQHGFYSEKQANMIESANGRDDGLEIPVVSLYAETREPSPEVLEKIDILLVDLQDVGTRVYTYTTTMGLCLEAAARRGIKVVVLDRPNPINGMEIEGNTVNEKFRSFVGRYHVPMRHGLTPGEFARYIQMEENIDCELEVVSMEGWRRNQYFDSLDLNWVFPSPNMPTWDTALLYPGMVLLEGTNVSEGRGTTMPFQLFGAPFLNQKEIRNTLEGSGLQGAVFRPIAFEPAFDKYRGKTCFGFQIHVTDRKRFKPYRMGLSLLQAFCTLHPDRFRWLDPPYEYEWEKRPIDILIGDASVRSRVESGDNLENIESDWQESLDTYREKHAACLLYPE